MSLSLFSTSGIVSHSAQINSPFFTDLHLKYQPQSTNTFTPLESSMLQLNFWSLHKDNTQIVNLIHMRKKHIN